MMVPTTQLGRPALRQWELTEDSSRYDRNRAAPSDEELHNVWISWSTFYFLFATFNLVVLLGTISSRKVRRKPFNMYLIYLMIPDVFMTGSCAITCAYLAAKGGFTHPWICKFQSFYIMFGVGSNAWLNGVVVYELYTLLSLSYRRVRYFPPTFQRVSRNCVIVYIYAGIIAALGVAEWEYWPHLTDSQNGLVCIPMAYDRKSSLFTWLVYTPLHNAIPVIYVTYATIQIIRKGLLPPSGKRRELAIFFTRIVVVFVAMWLPGYFVIYAFGGVDPWVMYVASIWTHSQGAVSAAVSLLKKDIREATLDLVLCRRDDRSGSFRLSSTGLSFDNSRMSGSRRNRSSFFHRLSISRITHQDISGPASRKDGSAITEIAQDSQDPSQAEVTRIGIEQRIEEGVESPKKTTEPASDTIDNADSGDSSNRSSEDGPTDSEIDNML